MKTVFQTLLRAIVGTSADDLARQVQFLKGENEILRAKLPKRITVTAPERKRLVKFGKPLGEAITALISIVAPRTFLRWVQEEQTPKPQPETAPKPGRPRTKVEVRERVLKLARQTGWGQTRILGELKKLGVGKIARSTVVNILKKAGIDTGPRRGEGTWDEFIKRHAQTLWACDFFSKKVWTLCGKVEVFVLFFLHIGTRRVHLAGRTANPDKPWMTQQARNLGLFFADQPVPPRFLLRDNDSKFVAEFDAILQDEEIEVKRLPLRSPNRNAFAERFVLSIKSECLNHFMVLGEDHLRYITSEYIKYYHEERPHQGMDNRPLNGAAPPAESPVTAADVVCAERLGGLLRRYRRVA